MNITEFKNSMQRGLGRCYLELKNCADIEKYRKIILWGCLHRISYDPQCEGTRAAYLYRLISFFPDREYFVGKIVEKYHVISGRDTWFFQQLTELLSFFSDDGFQTAKDALSAKYAILYAALLNKKNFREYDFRRDNFEFLSIVFLDQYRRKIPKKLIVDFGNLFLKNRHYGLEWHFGWFICRLEKSIGKKKLIGELEKRQNIPEWKSFYDSYLEAKEAESNASPKEYVSTAEKMKNSIDSNCGIAKTRIRFSRRADNFEKGKLAELIEKESDPEKKAEMLKAIWNENYPGDHHKLIEYAESDCEELSFAANETLSNCQSETVYRYAKEKLQKYKSDETAIEILLSNYRTTDKSFILSALNEFSVDYDEESGWHGIVMHILKVKDFGIHLPREFYNWIYENSLCSFCRENAVRYMGKRHWLSQKVLTECLYDSNDDIVLYVSKK